MWNAKKVSFLKKEVSQSLAFYVQSKPITVSDTYFDFQTVYHKPPKCYHFTKTNAIKKSPQNLKTKWNTQIKFIFST